MTTKAALAAFRSAAVALASLRDDATEGTLEAADERDQPYFDVLHALSGPVLELLQWAADEPTVDRTRERLALAGAILDPHRRGDGTTLVLCEECGYPTRGFARCADCRDRDAPPPEKMRRSDDRPRAPGARRRVDDYRLAA